MKKLLAICIVCLCIAVMPAMAQENNTTVDDLTPAPTEPTLVTPIVNLRLVDDVMGMSHGELVELCVCNPSVNNVTLTERMRVSMPSGIHVCGVSGADRVGAGTAVGTFKLPPGTFRTIRLKVKSEKVGNFTVYFTGRYWHDDRMDDFQQFSRTYPITVDEGGSIEQYWDYGNEDVTPQLMPAPTGAEFWVGPTVVLLPENDVINKSQYEIVTLYMNNPSVNDVTLTADVQIAVPSGILVYGEGFGYGDAAGTVAGKFEVPPETVRTIHVPIKSEKTGTFTVHFTGLYWPGDDKDAFQQISLTCPITVVNESSSDLTDSKPTREAGKGESPYTYIIIGFMVVISIVFILLKRPFELLVCILILSASIGYIFITDRPPSIHLNDIEDCLTGDDVLVSGDAAGLDGHKAIIILTKNKFIDSTAKTTIKKNRFNAIIDTSYSDGGKYTITAVCENHSDTKTFHLFSSLVEKISTERSVYIKGDPIKVVVSLKNPHKEERNLNLNLQLDNKVIRPESVSIPAEGFKNIDFALNDVDVGTHKVSVGGYEASFEVKPVPFIRLNTIKHDISIGNPLTISGTSKLPDGTKIGITIRNGVILVQNTASVMNGRFSIEIDTSNVKEGIYNIIAEEPVRKLSDSTEVTFYVQYPDIQTIGLSVSPSMVIVGDTVTVDATLKNTGNIVGTRNVTLKIDGTVVQSKTVTLHPDKMKMVSFDMVTTQSDVGRRTISVKDKTAVLIVKPTPQISLDVVEDVKIGDILSISGSTNLEDGIEILIDVESDAYRFEPEVVTVRDGGFTKILDTSDATEGVYEITAKDAKTIHGARDVGSVFLFSTKPTMSISLSVSSKDILVGQPEKVFARVTNSGDVREEITLSLKMDGMEKDLQTVTVEANNFNTATFEIQNPDIGTHIIDVNGYKTMFSVIAPSPILPHISTDKLSIYLYSTKTTISSGGNIIVTLSAVNKITNDEDLHLQLILTVPSGISATSSEGAFSITGGQATFDGVLEPGGKISGITLNLMPNEVGSYTIKGDVIYQVGDEKFDEEVYLPIFVGS